MGHSDCEVCGRVVTEAAERARVRIRPREIAWTSDSFICDLRLNSYPDYLKFLLMWSNEWPKSQMLQELDVHEQTLRQWEIYLQELIMLEISAPENPDDQMIDGPAQRVQIDETFINRRKRSVLAGVARPQAQQVCLWGAVLEATETSEFVFAILRCPEEAADGRPRGKKELNDVIRKSIKPGSHVTSDSWRAYTYIDWNEMGNVPLPGQPQEGVRQCTGRPHQQD